MPKNNVFHLKAKLALIVIDYLASVFLRQVSLLAAQNWCNTAARAADKLTAKYKFVDSARDDTTLVSSALRPLFQCFVLKNALVIGCVSMKTHYWHLVPALAVP